MLGSKGRVLNISGSALLLFPLLVFLFLASSAPAPWARAQSGVRPRTSSPADDDVIDVRTTEVLLPVSVRDSRGRPVNGLSANDFFIYDNGVRQQMASFNHRRVPANIILLLDASGSIFSQMRLIRDAASRFVRGLDAHDQVMVMQFADKVEVLQPWIEATHFATLD